MFCAMYIAVLPTNTISTMKYICTHESKILKISYGRKNRIVHSIMVIYA